MTSINSISNPSTFFNNTNFGAQLTPTSPFAFGTPRPQQTPAVFGGQQQQQPGTSPFGFGQAQLPTANPFGQQPQQQQQQPNPNPFGQQQQPNIGQCLIPNNNEQSSNPTGLYNPAFGLGPVQQQNVNYGIPSQNSTSYNLNPSIPLQPNPPNVFGIGPGTQIVEQNPWNSTPQSNLWYTEALRSHNDERLKGYTEADFSGTDAISRHLRHMLTKFEPQGRHLGQIKDRIEESQRNTNPQYGRHGYQTLLETWSRVSNAPARTPLRQHLFNSKWPVYSEDKPKEPSMSTGRNDYESWIARIDSVDHHRPSLYSTCNSTSSDTYSRAFEHLERYDREKESFVSKKLHEGTNPWPKLRERELQQRTDHSKLVDRKPWTEQVGKTEAKKDNRIIELVNKRPWFRYVGERERIEDAFFPKLTKSTEKLSVGHISDRWKRLDMSAVTPALQTALKRAKEGKYKRTLFDFGRRCYQANQGKKTQPFWAPDATGKSGPPKRNDAQSWTDLIKSRASNSQKEREFGQRNGGNKAVHYGATRDSTSHLDDGKPRIGTYQISTELGVDELDENGQPSNMVRQKALLRRRQEYPSTSLSVDTGFVRKIVPQELPSEINGRQWTPNATESSTRPFTKKNPNYTGKTLDELHEQVLTKNRHPSPEHLKTPTDSDAPAVFAKIQSGSRRSRSNRSKLKERSATLNSGVILTNPEYFCKPMVHELDQMTDSNGDCYIENFEIGHVEWGKVVFPGIVNVGGLDIDSTVQFDQGAITVSPKQNSTQREELSDRSAIVTYEKFKSPGEVSTEQYIEFLRKACKRVNGGEFLKYDVGTEKLVFKIVKVKNAPGGKTA